MIDEREARIRRTVGRQVLLLRKFSQADIVRATHLTADSVVNELERLRQEGVLELEGDEYKVTGDPEIRLAHSITIESYFPPIPESTEPTSKQFELAQKLRRQAEKTEGSQRKDFLDEAEQYLEAAFYSEGGNFMPDHVKEAIERERKRINELRE